MNSGTLRLSAANSMWWALLRGYLTRRRRVHNNYSSGMVPRIFTDDDEGASAHEGGTTQRAGDEYAGRPHGPDGAAREDGPAPHVLFLLLHLGRHRRRLLD